MLLDRSKRFTLDTLARLFIPTPTSSNYARRLFTHISTTIYTQVLIVQLSELGRREENENAKALKRLRRGFEPGSLDSESGILPRSTSFLRYCLFCVYARARACMRVCANECFSAFLTVVTSIRCSRGLPFSALSYLVSASYTEDVYGVVQQSLVEILTTLLSLYEVSYSSIH